MNAPSSTLPRFDLSRLRGDLLGGITAGIVALPLALGFGVASGLPDGAAAGLYGAIALGIVAALFGGTPAQVSGPTGPMTVVVAGLAVALGDPRLVFLAVVLAGAVQIGLGLLRLGRLIQFVPYPVVSGFMSGIGAIIIALQLPVLLGADPVKSPWEALRGLPAFLSRADLVSLGLGLATIAVIYATPRLTRAVPGTLVALLLGSGAAAALGLQVATISAIPAGLPALTLPPLGLEALRLALPAALVLGVLGAVDSLLTSLVADRITSTRHDSDRELVGQGLGNIAAGLIGGLPGAGATMRTVVNVQSGGRGRLSGAAHGVLLLGVLLGLAPLAQRIPLAVLAGILITVGVGILDYRGLRDLKRIPRGDAAVMLLVLLLTVLVDLMWAVGAGVIGSCLLVVKRLSDRLPATPAPEDAETPADVRVLSAGDAIFFGNTSRLRDVLAPETAPRALVICLSELEHVDQTGAYALADALQELQASGVDVRLAGVQREPARLLAELGIVPGVIAAERVHPDRRAALEAVAGPTAAESAASPEPSAVA